MQVKVFQLFAKHDYVVKVKPANLAVKKQVVKLGAALVVFPIYNHTFGNIKNFGKFELADTFVHIEFARFALAAALALVVVEPAAHVSAQVDVVPPQKF